MNHGVAGMILAAGAGRRYGRAKGGVREAGKSWLARAAERMAAGGLDPILAILGAQAEEIRSGADEARLQWVYNRQWEQGRTGSIQCGLRSLDREVEAVLLHQVDFPQVRMETFRTLRERFYRRSPEEQVFLPVFAGRRGHPILVAREVWPEILALSPDQPLFQVVARIPDRLREVPVEDPGIHENRNEPPEKPMTPGGESC